MSRANSAHSFLKYALFRNKESFLHLMKVKSKKKFPNDFFHSFEGEFVERKNENKTSQRINNLIKLDSKVISGIECRKMNLASKTNDQFYNQGNDKNNFLIPKLNLISIQRDSNFTISNKDKSINRVNNSNFPTKKMISKIIRTEVATQRYQRNKLGILFKKNNLNNKTEAKGIITRISFTNSEILKLPCINSNQLIKENKRRNISLIQDNSKDNAKLKIPSVSQSLNPLKKLQFKSFENVICSYNERGKRLIFDSSDKLKDLTHSVHFNKSKDKQLNKLEINSLDSLNIQLNSKICDTISPSQKYIQMKIINLNKNSNDLEENKLLSTPFFQKLVNPKNSLLNDKKLDSKHNENDQSFGNDNSKKFVTLNNESKGKTILNFNAESTRMNLENLRKSKVVLISKGIQNRNIIVNKLKNIDFKKSDKENFNKNEKFPQNIEVSNFLKIKNNYDEISNRNTNSFYPGRKVKFNFSNQPGKENLFKKLD